MQVRVRHQPSFAVARLELTPGEPVQVESGAMMATSYGVTVQSQANGGIMKGLGRAFLDVITLRPGEAITVGTGHVVAYADTVQYQLRKVAQGVIQSMKSGEGFVFDFAGPGQILMQTRNPSSLISWILSHVPSR
ncbi:MULTISPECIES: AIM24 family protein [unclassified Amycolatopsis]|uniref:AIM24 family protein n=1 Tax=unclassified Amycolatopsis TaxID=2618356 RepID=UPI001C69DE53|nr:AIM24 family protein [Amycolatopsis sp. DSM 110486]QYN23426.1 AIM24 family protein [Amycolatopsis sp. DSM 110486]